MVNSSSCKLLEEGLHCRVFSICLVGSHCPKAPTLWIGSCCGKVVGEEPDDHKDDSSQKCGAEDVDEIKCVKWRYNNEGKCCSPTGWMSCSGVLLSNNCQRHSQSSTEPKEASQASQSHQFEYQPANCAANSVPQDHIARLCQGCFACTEDQDGHSSKWRNEHDQVQRVLQTHEVSMKQAQDCNSGERPKPAEGSLSQRWARHGSDTSPSKLAKIFFHC
mmetsp:Transcript_77102/g.136053  ORF Transcript_77102/g.136053 Transcript_77102/m.136053 type:complete len:219 (-) Transcript_77102:446-1102(-)